MKKRLLSALLALALVFVLLPTTALAKVVTSDEDISIAGIDWKFGSDSEVGYFYNGNFTTDEPNGSYLKLTKNSNTITVTVYGNVTVSDIKVHKNFDIGEKINLIITGGNKRSTLTLNCTGISGAALETFQSGDITIKDGITVNANFSADNTDKYTDCYGIRASKNLIITGKGTTVNAVNADDAAAVKVDGNITVSDGAQLKATNKYSKKVTSYTDNAYAIECGGQLSISGDKTQVTAKTSNGKKAISGTVSNGDKLTFKVQLYLASSTLYQKPMDKALEYAYVEITQAPTDPYVFIADEPAIMGQETPIPGGSGTYLYKDEGNNGSTLTLKGVDITGTKDGPARFIQFGENGYYTIKLEGENKISGFSSGIVAPEDPGVNDVTVVLSGSGSLDITANQYAIDMQVGKLKFENTGTIKLTTGYNYYVNPLNALRVKTGNISIDNTKYDIVGARQEKNYPTETISDSSAFTPDLLNGYTVGEETTLFKTITITPAAAKDSTIRYNGTTLKQGETIRNGGTATVDSKNNTITLKNFNGTAALSFDATLADSTLVLEGTNTLSSIVTTQKGLTISGSGSLTVGSIRVPNNTTTSNSPSLTIDGAKVTAGTPTSTTRAVEVKGDLTVTNGSLTATSKSDSVPTVQVGGNASFTGSTVTITNNSTTQGERYKDSNAASSALHVNGAVTISGGTVMAEAKAGGNAIRAVGNITVSNGATVTAKNNSQYFNAITAGSATGGEVKTLHNLIVSGENTRITATNTHDNNLTYGGAINAYIKNANEGHYLQVGTDTKAIAPNVNTTVKNNSLTITRGDEVTRTNSPVVIAGTTLLNDTHYTITNGSKVAEGTDNSNYNAFYDSETKTLKLNNASINGTGVKAIEANVGGYTFTIELVGNNIIKTSGFANNVIDITGNLYFTGSGTAEVSGKGTPIYATYKIDVSADVTITNTEKAGSFTFSAYGENSSNYKGANTFAIGTGYTAYATTDKTTWAVYDNTTASENESYTTLRITTQPPETGGGSTHQHTWDTTKWYDVGDGYHANKCTGCTEYDLTNKKAHVAWPDESKGSEGHTEKCMLCDYKYDQSVIKPHEWTGWWVSDYQPEVHAQRCNCGYLGSTHSTLKYVAINGEQHQKQCPVDGCDYKIESSTTAHVYEEGSNICTECGYDKSAPCNHTGDRVYTNNGDGTHKVTCKACGATIVEKETHEFDPTGACVCGATQSGGNPTPDNPGTIVIIRPAEEEKPAQQPNPSTGANDLVGMAVAAAVVAVLGSAALLRKHD